MRFMVAMAMSMALAVSPRVAHACWEPALQVDDWSLADTSTTLTVLWTPLASVDQCSSAIDPVAYYQIETGASSSPTSAGAGSIVARLADISGDSWPIHVDSGSTTVYISIFACDADGDCVAPTDGRLTATTDP